jgi:hypothetical protein
MRTFKMVKVLPIVSLLFLIGSCFVSCNDTDDGSYVAPITLYEKVSGKWMLNSIKQVDEISSQSMALTSSLSFDSFAIDLNTDAKENPTTFTVEGTAPAILPTSGTWEMGNKFTNSDGTAAKILLHGTNKTYTLTVTNVPGSDKVLEFKLTRKAKGKAFVSYVYNLIPDTIK